MCQKISNLDLPNHFDITPKHAGRAGAEQRPVRPIITTKYPLLKKGIKSGRQPKQKACNERKEKLGMVERVNCENADKVCPIVSSVFWYLY